MELEVFLDPFISRVIDHSRIKQYKIQYKPAPSAIMRNAKQHQNEPKTISTNRIYDDGISFMRY